MRKGIVILLVLLFLISVLFIIIPPEGLYIELMGENVSYWHITLLIILGLIVNAVIRFLETKYPAEYKEADKISYTPHTKYGWYALIFSILFSIFFCLYAILSK